MGLWGVLAACISLPFEYAAMEDAILDGDGDAFVDCAFPDEVPEGASCDCDDASADVGPGLDELCDGVDNDCDGQTDEGVAELSGWFVDADGDGAGAASHPVEQCPIPADAVENADDCDDGSAAVVPGAIELCNSVDDDCDGAIDEGLDVAWYDDQDDDGVGAGDPVEQCAAPGGHVDLDGDCDDTDDSVFPGAEEVCGDGVVNDCLGDGSECAWTGALVREDDPRIQGTGAECTRFGTTLHVGSFMLGSDADLLAGCTDSTQGYVYGITGVEAEGDYKAGVDTVWTVGRAGSDRGPEVLTLDAVGGTQDEFIFGSRKAEEVVLFDRTWGVERSVADAEWVLTHSQSLTQLGASLAALSAPLDEPILAVGAPQVNNYEGAVYVLDPGAVSGESEVDSEADAVLVGSGGQFGSTLADRCDLDGDGQMDVVVGAPASGAVYVFTTQGSQDAADADGVLIGEETFGAALACGESAGGDSLLAVGQPGEGSAQGVSYRFSSWDGDADDVSSARFSGGNGGDEFGASLALGPFQATVDLLVVGAPGYDTSFDGANEGLVAAFDGVEGAHLLADAVFTVRTGVLGGGVGAAVTAPGDVDGDGLPDVAVGSASTQSVLFLGGLEL